ncbi:M48 family metallopeptidase [Sulfuriroseicoccus oceanibius]|uniref:M48 family metallopeptidase n=1 Tax=Sulfuriroseicoccus oceanibius TaxID=2707525 RepID=A0A6B3L2Z0_9BACT|nr:M48 family metallopeptidase [Sulfuriroseicoccus oceanibius]QQL44578.1 M48 family metallopeptidase [Sulfuriroseicoccus oceanibius]
MTPFAIALLIIVGVFLLESVATVLNSRSTAPRPPKGFEGVYDLDRYARSQEYKRTNSEFGLFQNILSLAALLAFWLLGGFGWLHEWSQTWQMNEILRGVCVIGLVGAVSSLISLPFSIYDTFVIEERFGFNKTTPRTFITDQLKSILLAVLLGGPLIAGVLWIFHTFDNAWLWAWGSLTAVTLLLSYLAPRFIMPLFYKFTPLEDGELQSAINVMAERCGFPVTGIYVIDGSRRSSKANAFFTGFGKNRKIALFDTLIDNHTTEELVGVLAHEIGHFKLRHIIQQMAFGILQTGLMLYLLNYFVTKPEIYQAFNVNPGTDLPVHFGIIFFMMLYGPIALILGIITNKLSRIHEFQADAYAAKATGTPKALASALKKLTADSLGNLTPHPMEVFLHYSHPPTPKRVAALEQMPVKPLDPAPAAAQGESA